MEEIPISQVMMNINLITNLENISLRHPQRILKIIGFIQKNQKREYLEIIIFKGFSSSTTHEIETDPEKDVLKENWSFVSCQLLNAPITQEDNFIKEEKDIKLFLNDQNWI